MLCSSLENERVSRAMLNDVGGTANSGKEECLFIRIISNRMFNVQKSIEVVIS